MSIQRFVTLSWEDLTDEQKAKASEDAKAFLVDRTTGRLVGFDGGEPSLRGDWRWVEFELNALAEQLRVSEMEHAGMERTVAGIRSRCLELEERVRRAEFILNRARDVDLLAKGNLIQTCELALIREGLIKPRKKA